VRDLLGDRYKVEEEIAAGGAARVFRAYDKTGQRVALKVLRPELMPSLTAKRFLREIEVLKKLDHPLIAKLLDYGEADWFIYFAMEWAEGPTLRQLLNDERRLGLEATTKCAAEVLDAIAHAHARGIVHRDVKPENIVLTSQAAMLLDFGIARAIAASEGQRVTRSGFTVGTSTYMSPEQALGEKVDERTDIYSLGCVMFECLAGQPPYSHPLESQVLQMHAGGLLPDVRAANPDVPEGLAQVIERALAKAPDDRYASADEMRTALHARVSNPF